MPDEPTDETVALLFDIAREAPGEVLDQIKSLQGRITQAFTAGTVLIGFAGLATVSGSHLTHATLGALAMAGLCYLVVLIVAILTLLPAWGYGLPDPETLWNTYRTFSPRRIQEAFLEALARDWPTNRGLVTLWDRAARVGVIFLGAETVAVAVGLVLSRVNT
jgi:hypothetical protein